MSRKTVGAYLLGSNGLRFKCTDSLFPKNVWFEFIKPSNTKQDILTLRADAVFRQYENETLTMLDILVIVNSNLYPLEAVKNVVEIAKNYAHEVHVVSPAFARVMYAIKESSLDLNDGQKCVIITIANETNVTFHIIIATLKGTFKLILSENCLFNEAFTKLKIMTNEHTFTKYIFLCGEKFLRKASYLKRGYSNSDIITYDRWDHMLNEGSLLKASEIIKSPNERMCNLENFSDGIIVEYSKNYKKTLVKPGQTLPIQVSLTEPLGSNINIFSYYHSDIVDVFKEMKLVTKEATFPITGQANKHLRIELNIDAFGVPEVSSHNMTAVDIHKETLMDTCIASCSLYTGDIKLINSTMNVNTYYKMDFEKTSVLSLKDIKKRCQEVAKSILKEYKIKTIILVQDEEPDDTYIKMFNNKAENCVHIPVLAAKLYYCLSKITTEQGKDVTIITSDLNGIRLYIFTKKPHAFELIHWRTLSQDELISRRSVGLYTTSVGYYNFLNVKNQLKFSPWISNILKEFNVTSEIEDKGLIAGAMAPYIDRRCRIHWNNFKKQLFPLKNAQNVDLIDEFPLFNKSLWPEVTVDLSWESFSVLVFTSEDDFEKVNDVNGKEQTPLYISFPELNQTRIGDVAKKELQKMPESVVFGIMDMIGMPLENINKQKKWKFNLFKNDDDKVMIAVKFNDTGRVRPFKLEFFLAAFLVAAIKQAKEKIDNIKNIAIVVPSDFDIQRFPAIKEAALMTKINSIEIRQKPFGQ